MLHNIINEQGHCLDVRDGISAKMNICHMFSYTSLLSGASLLEIILTADYQAHVPLLQML